MLNCIAGIERMADVVDHYPADRINKGQTDTEIANVSMKNIINLDYIITSKDTKI